MHAGFIVEQFDVFGVDGAGLADEFEGPGVVALQ
jgi:hypothetical protein